MFLGDWTIQIDTEQWLKFLGVYEETMAAIDKWIKKRDGGSKSSTKKKKPKKDDGKLKNILSTLTEEEKKKLKEML